MTHGFWKRSRRPGARRLIATALRRLADGVERPWPRLAAARGMVSASPTLMSPEYIRFQRMPHRVLARYVAIAGTQVLEIGGAQACISARAFLDDGAAGVTVTGLDHVAEESESADRRLRIMKADALDLRRHFEADCFDLVFGLSVIEHIPHPDRLLVEVDRVLKPGGLALFEGYPLWWSPLGHHLWVAAWGGRYAGKTSASYLFTGVPRVRATNPVPDWAHLLMEREELEHYLALRSLPPPDIGCIADWIYEADDINRLSTPELMRCYTTSPLTVLEAAVRRVDVPETTLHDLRRRHGDGCDFGAGGLTVVLRKPPRGGGVVPHPPSDPS